MNLEQLQKLRDRAGITFTKSFNCIDAEKNIHLADKDQFFKKFTERLEKMGYVADKDFDFEVIRYKIQYAERHHVGRTYEWKYFYSTTFEIDEELLEYLKYHKFIKKKENKTKKSIKENKPSKSPGWEEALEINKQKIRKFNELLKGAKEINATENIANYTKAIENCYKKIDNIKRQIEREKEDENRL